MMREAVVDHLGVDGGLAQLGGAGEELGDQQVLPLRVSSTNPNGTAVGSPWSRISRRA
jgi:hypothetical protein